MIRNSSQVSSSVPLRIGFLPRFSVLLFTALPITLKTIFSFRRFQKTLSKGVAEGKEKANTGNTDGCYL